MKRKMIRALKYWLMSEKLPLRWRKSYRVMKRKGGVNG